MGACLHRFVELAQKRGIAGPCVIHMECTELYCFTPFLHELGVPIVDGVNVLTIASRCTDAPLKFVTYKQDARTMSPRPPAALVADTSGSIAGARFYRDEAMLIRGPTICAGEYAEQQALVMPLFRDLKQKWETVELANIVIGGKELKWGLDSFWSAKPGDSLYVASSGLAVERYVDVEQGEDPTPPAFKKPTGVCKFDESHVEYGSRDGNKGDVGVFFGGDAIYDRTPRPSTDCIAASPVHKRARIET